MAQEMDWVIVPKGKDVKVGEPVATTKTHDYDLVNRTNAEAVVYGHRAGDNINLVWGDPDKSDNIRFERANGGTGPIKFGEPIAINIRQGKYLVYKGGRWGINLGWSDSPKAEWRITGGKDGDPVTVGAEVGLFNEVEKDVLMYEARDWGINLKWFKDSGEYAPLTSGSNFVKSLLEKRKALGL